MGLQELKPISSFPIFAESIGPGKFTMSEEEQKKAAQWMTEKAPEIKCAVCGHEQFQVMQDFVVAQIVQQSGMFAITDHFIPFFLAMCTKCGNTLFLNAMLSGVMKPNVPPGQNPQQPMQPQAGNAGEK